MFEHKKMIRCFMNGKSCIYERAIDERIEAIKSSSEDRRAFIIMPFDTHLDAIYQWQLAPFISVGGSENEEKYACKPERADDIRRVGYIICEKICKKIQEANLLVADVSFDNPNVFYELGMGIALSKPILPICLEDIKGHRKEELSRLIGIDTLLGYPSFGFLKGKISSHLINLAKYAGYSQQKGNKLIVLHDGRTINIHYKSESDLIKYNCGDLFVSAAGTAMKNIFEASNIEKHPELKRYQKNEFTEMKELNLKEVSFEKVLQELQESYCILIDTNANSPGAFFWLGYIHAIGGFAIPINVINNKEDTRHNIPFDIRSLWHIYYNIDRPVDLANSLKNILEFVLIERSKYLQRDKFWNRILKDNKVSIFLGSINMPDLGRNTLGDWDYRTAAELTSYLSKKKETMEVNLESPLQKYTERPSDEQINWLQDQLADKNCIIVASSDVNDLTEIALSEIWKRKPFEPVVDKEMFDGFIAYKTYPKGRISSIAPSTFYRCHPTTENKPPERGFILRLGANTTERHIVEDHFFPDEPEAHGAHILLGQLVVARNPFPLPKGSDNKWLIIISGISGPATLGIAQMLTGCVYSEFTINKIRSEESSDDFQNVIESILRNGDFVKKLQISGMEQNFYRYDELSEIRLKELNKILDDEKCKGVNALVYIGVYYPEHKQFHDERKIISWSFVDLSVAADIKQPNPRAIDF